MQIWKQQLNDVQIVHCDIPSGTGLGIVTFLVKKNTKLLNRKFKRKQQDYAKGHKSKGHKIDNN